MSEAGFTKGPWRTGLSDAWCVEGHGDHSSMHVLAGGSTVPIALVCAEHSQNTRCDELAANALLIAASPSMYEVLKELSDIFVQDIDPCGHELEIPRALLLKVRKALALAVPKWSI